MKSNRGEKAKGSIPTQQRQLGCPVETSQALLRSHPAPLLISTSRGEAQTWRRMAGGGRCGGEEAG